MKDRYTEDEIITAVTLLTKVKLTAFIEARFVSPAIGEIGLVFRRVDLARLELLCELSEDFDLNEDALEIIMSLIDQLHGARADLRALVEAITTEPPEVRARIGEAVRVRRSVK